MPLHHIDMQLNHVDMNLFMLTCNLFVGGGGGVGWGLLQNKLHSHMKEYGISYMISKFKYLSTLSTSNK